MTMPADQTSEVDREALIKLARQALHAAVCGEILPELDYTQLSDHLKEFGATFVTLTKNGELRGCIGILEANKPLADDVCQHAVAAALEDYRFPPVQPDELDQIKIEISRLTQPVDLNYVDSDDLLRKLRPGVHGVILRDGWNRATFLPQVWEKLPDPAEFLSHLCYKMGASPQLWRQKKLDVKVYTVEEFRE